MSNAHRRSVDASCTLVPRTVQMRDAARLSVGLPACMCRAHDAPTDYAPSAAARPEGTLTSFLYAKSRTPNARRSTPPCDGACMSTACARFQPILSGSGADSFRSAPLRPRRQRRPSGTRCCPSTSSPTPPSTPSCIDRQSASCRRTVNGGRNGFLVSLVGTGTRARGRSSRKK